MTVLYWPRKLDTSGLLIGWYFPDAKPSTVIVAGCIECGGESMQTNKASVKQKIEQIRQSLCSCCECNDVVKCNACLQVALFQTLRPIAIADERINDPKDDSNLIWEDDLFSSTQTIEQLIYYDTRILYQTRWNTGFFSTDVVPRLSHASTVLEILHSDQRVEVSSRISERRRKRSSKTLPGFAMCSIELLSSGYQPALLRWNRPEYSSSCTTCAKKCRTHSRYLQLKHQVARLSYRIQALADLAVATVGPILFYNRSHEIGMTSATTYQRHYGGLRLILAELNNFPIGIKLNERLTERATEELLRLFRTHEDCFSSILKLPLVPVLMFALCIGALLLGVPFVLSVVIDVLDLAFAHITLLSRAIRNLYALELSLLRSLWILFNGKKKNVLRNRVDTMYYDSIQLLIGIIAFTNALFLFTTILSYHIVFGALSSAIEMIRMTLLFLREAFSKEWMSSLLLRFVKPSELTFDIYLARDAMGESYSLEQIPKSMRSILGEQFSEVPTDIARFVKTELGKLFLGR